MTSYPMGIVRIGLCLVLMNSMLQVLSGQEAQHGSIFVGDADGLPLESVQVFNDDYTFTAVSDENGLVPFPNHKDILYLNFTYIGYATQRLSIADLKHSGAVSMASVMHELEIVEIVGRYGKTKEEFTQVVEVVGKKEIAFTSSQTTADAIDQHTNVYVQKSQMGGGSPIIRGFEANKILLVVDGVRMNNAIYRSGHLQNAITIGNAMLERIEVLYGPGSIGYGSDALGGVIHFRTKDPELSFTEGKLAVNAGANLRYATANKEKAGQINFGIAGNRFGSLTSFSYSDYDDLRTGSKRDARFPDHGKRPDYQVFQDGRDTVLTNPDPNVQIGTGYSQYDFQQKLKFEPNDKLQIIGNFQFSTSSDIPRYDNLSERDSDSDSLKWSDWSYGPQKRIFASVKANWFEPTKIFDNAQIIVAFQSIHEKRITRRFGRQFREYQDENVNVWSATLDFSKSVDKRRLHAIEYGIDFQSDEVKSTAFSEDINTLETQEDILTRYPDGESGMLTFGVYSKYIWHNSQLTKRFEAGVRFANTTSDLRYERTDIIDWPAHLIEGVKNKNSALTGSLSWRGQFVSWLRYRLMASSAYRVPNIDDLAKIRARGGNVLVPNLDLKPETAYTLEATLSQESHDLIPLPNSGLQIDITGYYTRVRDAIIRSDYQLPNGDTLLEVSGDPLRVQANINAQNAFVYGLSANLRLWIYKNWTLKSSFNYVKGRSQVGDRDTDDQPLAHIAPNYGRTSVNYASDKIQVEFAIKYNGSKPIEDYAPGSSDNEDFATPIGSLAWTTLNIYASYQLTDNFSLTFALENIADVHYRMFSSGVSAPGRNFVVGVSGSF
jgi:hemoglobin/transferrin/lactoferrin receptor protein